jgi:hypothetical protein
VVAEAESLKRAAESEIFCSWKPIRSGIIWLRPLIDMGVQWCGCTVSDKELECSPGRQVILYTHTHTHTHARARAMECSSGRQVIFSCFRHLHY